jgi:pimeloyl-ACP methyl ester carboxylesterase
MFLDIDGNRVFTLDFGSGPKTLLAHSGWVGNFEDWIGTLAPISKHWRTVIYDHRGTGETVVPVERITADALVDDVFRVMDALDIDRCILAGFSRGTVTAIQAALRDPSRFDGLILMNGHGGVVDPSIPMPPAVPLKKWPGATHADRLRWFVDGCTPEPDSEHIRRWAMNILSRATPEAAERIAKLILDRFGR